MDNWNPILAEQEVKHVPWWQIAIGMILFVVGSMFGAWALTVVIFSLGR